MRGIRVRSERGGGEGTSKGRPLARSELGLAEKTRVYLLSLDLCRIRDIPVRGVVGWRSCALLFWTSNPHNREDEERERVRVSSGDGAPGDGNHGASRSGNTF